MVKGSDGPFARSVGILFLFGRDDCGTCVIGRAEWGHGRKRPWHPGSNGVNGNDVTPTPACGRTSPLKGEGLEATTSPSSAGGFRGNGRGRVNNFGKERTMSCKCNCTKKAESKKPVEVVASRKSCKAEGTGLSHYILTDKKAKK